MFYATRDADDGHISENAHIVAFDTREAAEAWLNEPFACNDFIVTVEDGYFGDAWYRLHAEPSADDDFAPFTFDQLVILKPGQNPGGNQFWVEPRPTILVAILSEI